VVQPRCARSRACLCLGSQIQAFVLHHPEALGKMQMQSLPVCVLTNVFLPVTQGPPAPFWPAPARLVGRRAQPFTSIKCSAEASGNVKECYRQSCWEQLWRKAGTLPIGPAAPTLCCILLTSVLGETSSTLQYSEHSRPCAVSVEP
jgi:hypothetical protein